MPTEKSAHKKRAFQRFLDWYLGWLGRIFTGKF
jgi:hypothetical protein